MSTDMFMHTSIMHTVSISVMEKHLKWSWHIRKSCSNDF